MRFLYFKISFIFSLLINNLLIAQHARFYDSLAFFEREKVSSFIIKLSSKSKVFKTTKVIFENNRKKVIFENQLIGSKNKSPDTLGFINGFLTKSQCITYDKSNRITKIIDSLENKIYVSEYFYTDSISKRLRMVINQSENEYYQINVYLYKKFKLIEVVETFYELLNNEHKKVWQKSYNYEYDAKNRIKFERIKQVGKLDYVAEYVY